MDRFSGQTGVIPYTSRLVRQKWLRQGIVPVMETSFWGAYIGNSKSAAVYQANDFSAGHEHNVIFDFDGFLVGEGKRGKEQAYGYGETKKKFSSHLTIERGRYIVHNDAYLEAILRKDPEFKDIMKHADVRGQKNRLIQGYIGHIGQLDIITAPSFFGTSSSNLQYKTSVVASGMRAVNSAGKYQGEQGYTLEGEKQVSRAIILGQSAIQLAGGKSPDFKLQESEDFGIDSESAIIVYSRGQRTRLDPETEDYENEAKQSGIDFGLFAADFYIAG